MWERQRDRSGREKERDKEGRETEWQECKRDRIERKGERQGSEREKDKKRFRLGERKIGREAGVVEIWR